MPPRLFLLAVQREAGRKRVDRDPHSMFNPLIDGGKKSKKGRKGTKAGAAHGESVGEALIHVEKLAMHSEANISHKDQLAVFASATFITMLCTDLGLFTSPSIHQSMAKLGGIRRSSGT